MAYEDQSDPTLTRGFGRLRHPFFRNDDADADWLAELARQRADIERAVAAEQRRRGDVMRGAE